MHDTLTCPMCGNKLKSRDFNYEGKYISRICDKSNHSVIFTVDKITGKVTWIKISFDCKHSKFVEINYIDNISKISFYKDSSSQSVEIPHTLELDFPNLEKLKNKVNVYVTFI